MDWCRMHQMCVWRECDLLWFVQGQSLVGIRTSPHLDIDVSVFYSKLLTNTANLTTTLLYAKVI